MGAVLRTAWSGLGIAMVAALAAAISISFIGQRPIIVAALVVTLLLPLLVTMLGNPRLLCLWVLGFALPLEFSKFFGTLPHMGGEYAFRIELSDAFMVALAFVFWIDRLRGQAPRLWIPKVVWPWVFLIALTAVDVGIREWKRAAAMEVIRMGKALVLFVLVVNTLRTRGDFRHFFLAFAGSLFLQGFYGILQYFFNLDLGLQRLGENTAMMESVGGRALSRVSALLGHPNLLSGFLAMAMPIPLAFLFMRDRLYPKLFALIALTASAVTLILTLSRNGWLAFAAAAGIVVVGTTLHRPLRMRTAMLRGLLIAFGFVILLGASKVIIDRFLRSDPTNVRTRFQMYTNALEMVQAKPAFGFGKNSYAYVMASEREFRPGRASVYREEVYGDPRSVPPIHNIYLQQWVEQGTVGFIAFLYLLAVILGRAWRNRKIQDDTLFLANLGAAAGVLAILIHGLADWVFWWNGIMRVFWSLAAVVYAAAALAPRLGRAALPRPATAPALTNPRAT